MCILYYDVPKRNSSNVLGYVSLRESNLSLGFSPIIPNDFLYSLGPTFLYCISNNNTSQPHKVVCCKSILLFRPYSLNRDPQSNSSN